MERKKKGDKMTKNEGFFKVATIKDQAVVLHFPRRILKVEVINRTDEPIWVSTVQSATKEESMLIDTETSQTIIDYQAYEDERLAGDMLQIIPGATSTSTDDGAEIRMVKWVKVKPEGTA